MHKLTKVILYVSVGILALTPPLLSGDGWQFAGSAWAKNSGGNNGGGSDGGSSGGNNGGHGTQGGSSRFEAGSASKSSTKAASKAQSKSEKTTKSKQIAAISTEKAKLAKAAKNMHAQLKGLNSLKRNVNGLMNSADPRMAGIRAFVEASAALAAAEAALADAKLELVPLEEAFNDLIEADATLPTDPAAALTALNTELSALTLAEPAPDDAASAAWATEVAALTSQIKTVTDYQAAQTKVTEADIAATPAVAGTTDTDLKAALAAAANPNSGMTPENITPEVLDWAKATLGVGDAVGTIDQYAAQQL